MTWWTRLRNRWGKRPPPVITTYIDGKEHEVTEWARHQAAMNMRGDSEIKERVVAYLKQQYGDEVGLAEAKRRYPEAGWEDYK